MNLYYLFIIIYLFICYLFIFMLRRVNKMQLS